MGPNRAASRKERVDLLPIDLSIRDDVVGFDAQNASRTRARCGKHWLEQHAGTRGVSRRTVRHPIIYWTWDENPGLISDWGPSLVTVYAANLSGSNRSYSFLTTA
jgi:hypothetical protein